MTVRCHKWDAPSTIDVPTMRALTSSGMPANALTGRHETRIIDHAGRWSNYDVYCRLPASWVATIPPNGGPGGPAVVLRFYTWTQGIRALVSEVQVPTLALDSNGAAGTTERFSGFAFRIRGAPCSKFEITALTLASVLAGAEFTIEAWGTESTPENVGPLLAHANGIKDEPEPTRGSKLLGWDEENERWKAIWMDPATGALVVVGSGGGGSTIVTGTETQQGAGGEKAPTGLDDALAIAGVSYFYTGSGYQQTVGFATSATIAPARLAAAAAGMAISYAHDGADYRRLDAQPLNTEPAGASTYAPWTNVALHAANAGSFLVCTFQSGTRNLNVREAALSLSADSTAADIGTGITKVVKALGAQVGQFDAVNSAGALQYFQLHNKPTPLAPGDVPLHSFAVQPGARVEKGREFFSAAGELFSLGLSWGWSTTAATYTAGAAGETVNVRYV